MADHPLRTNQAVNFRIPGQAKLLHFLSDWFELEVSKFFTLSLVPQGAKEPILMQAVPNGKGPIEDEGYFHLLDRSLDTNGMLEFWKEHAEFLPRIGAVEKDPPATS